MDNNRIHFQQLLLGISLIIILSIAGSTYAQDQRWIVIGETQCFFMDYGSELELTSNANYFTWPTQYGDDQNTMRQKGLWIGAKNFYDPAEEKVKSVKVIGSGPREPANHYTMIFPQDIKLVGRFDHPVVEVDEQIGTSNVLYDVLDELDGELSADRLVESHFNTSMGVSVRRRVLGFAQQNHDNYFIQEYVFKNTGIYNEDGDEYHQDLNDFWIYFCWRPAFAGVTSSEYGSTWGSFASQWGTSNLLHTFNINSPEAIRGFYSWYGPTNSYSHPLTPQQDWGCPDHEETGMLGSAKYMGGVTLFASQSTQAYTTDDPSQPATDAYVGSDGTPMEASVSQYDEVFMNQRYHIMSEGHLPNSQVEDVFAAIGNDGYVEDWTESSPYRDTNTGGGTSQGWGFGPYTLNDGDSLRIVYAEGLGGLSWEKGREVGGNWYKYFADLPEKPELIMPDESTASSANEWGYDAHNAYKRAWCETGVDSIMQILRNARDNFNSGYAIPQPPPPPSNFTVTSGGDKITLTWADNATDDSHFDGYVIYRSEGSVKHYRTVYEKIFECSGGADLVHSFDDVTATRGFNYYYYIQSKDDGTQNEVEPGKPLYSSMFWTLTNVPAYLRRPAVTKDPKATPDVDTTYWKLNVPKEEWAAANQYYDREIVSYNGSNYLCIRDISHNTEPPVFNTQNWKLIIAKGEWNPATTYVSGDAIVYNSADYVCKYGISGGTWLDLVRVVPNPYDIRSRMYQFGEDFQYDRIAFYGLPPVCDVKVYTERGDLIWSKKHTDGSGDELWDSMTSSRQVVVSGIYILYVETPDGDSVIRKFVVIR